MCPANSLSQEGVAPCTQCPNDGGFHRYIGQRGDECRKGLDEVGILDALFYQTHGEEWKLTDKEKNGWTKGSPACQRKGVVCNESGLVTQINLSSMGLKGPLPTELGHLSNLLSLNLAHNKLTGFLPSDLRFLPLTDLDIRDNRMDGRGK